MAGGLAGARREEEKKMGEGLESHWLERRMSALGRREGAGRPFSCLERQGRRTRREAGRPRGLGGGLAGARGAP